MDGLRSAEPNCRRRTCGEDGQRTASPRSSLRSRAGLLYLIGLHGLFANRIDRVSNSEVSRHSRQPSTRNENSLMVPTQRCGSQS